MSMLIDGLQCSVYDRTIFAQLHQAQVSAVTITAAFWEDALETMDALGHWNDLARENADLITIARTAADIEAAAASGRTAILLGTQNSAPLNDRLRFVELFHAMGLRVMQLTYNNQNAIGGSCYEPADSGLTRFGREVVREMNRVGMLVDLSHVGDRTSADAIAASSVPVGITHANPRSLVDHPRNKAGFKAMTGPARPGRPVRLNRDTGSAAQVWEITYPGNGARTEIISKWTGLCLDAARHAAGAELITGICNGSKRQQWTERRQPNGTWRLSQGSSGPVLQAAFAGTRVRLAPRTSPVKLRNWVRRRLR